MSDHWPPSGTPEYLEPGSGRPLPPEPIAEAAQAPATRRRRRTPWVVAVAAVLLLGGAAATWAALSFFRQGAQPAEALPATTIAYVSVDLDPAGSQKIDAFRTLNKFPAFKDEVGVSSTDDVRRKIGKAFLGDLGCDGLTYDADIEPWLGDRAALAAVDVGAQDPTPVLVVQSKDDDRARAALQAFGDCSSDSPTGYAVRDGWVLISDSQDQIDKIAAAADEGTLADDATYQKWNDRLGDSGVVMMYAAPKLGAYLAGKVDEWSGLLGGNGSVFSTATTAATTAAGGPGPTAAAPGQGGELADQLRAFTGAAATIRFTGNGVELATVSDSALPGTAGFVGDRAGAGVTRLPDDTAAAFGVSLKPGWVQTMADRMGNALGAGMSRAQVYREIEQSTGLRLPDDLEALLGSSTTLAVGGDFDYEALSNAFDGSHIPMGAVVQGDPGRVEPVLDKLRGSDQETAQLLGSDSADGLVAIGPSADYRRQLLAGGHLGETDAFAHVVPAPDHASEIVFVDMDRFEKSLAEGTGSDPKTTENVKPIEAIGFSVWLDGELGRMALRVSTN